MHNPVEIGEVVGGGVGEVVAEDVERCDVGVQEGVGVVVEQPNCFAVLRVVGTGEVLLLPLID